MTPEFEILDTTTNWNLRGKPSMVRISRHGIIRFSVSAVKQMGLNAGMKLTFMLPKKDHEIIYIYQHPKGLELKEDTVKSKEGIALYCCGRKHSTRLLEHLKISKPNTTFDITKEKTIINDQECWFIQKEKIHKPIKWRKPSNIC